MTAEGFGAGITKDMPSHLAHGARISRHLGIGGQKQDPLDHRLSNQNAVEGIFVNGRQAANCDGMFSFNLKLSIAVFEQCPAQ